MKRTASAMTALLLLALAGCSSPSVDDAFLAEVRESVDAPSVAQSSDEDLIGLGKTVCQTFSDNGFEDGFILFLQTAKNAGMDTGDAGRISGAAVGAYCPEFSASFTG